MIESYALFVFESSPSAVLPADDATPIEPIAFPFSSPYDSQGVVAKSSSSERNTTDFFAKP